MAHTDDEELRMTAPPRLLEVARHDLAPGHLLLGPHLQWASLLGRRTAELHLALASQPRTATSPPSRSPPVDRQALFHGARSLAAPGAAPGGGARPRVGRAWPRCWPARPRSGSGCG